MEPSGMDHAILFFSLTKLHYSKSLGARFVVCGPFSCPLYTLFFSSMQLHISTKDSQFLVVFS